MSGFQNSSNIARVDRILEALQLMEKSAASNRTSTAEFRQMLTPVIERLTAIGILDAGEGEAPTQTVEAALTAGQRAALHLANRASTRDLTAALLGRLETQQELLERAET
ncbi:hypothetical protein KX928_23195 [Roseobacter sp. YSTF-M11]|uniref:Uncharacterized protein n=1 Tax=Roseobacter insulae TaxID=2859783 RepID=A0A9X1FZT2_9RHOB|nr:hypothetical protein [Roseobacter insulae]MBW4710706.1 hypothetical protein [Roseobacter insulae]